MAGLFANKTLRINSVTKKLVLLIGLAAVVLLSLSSWISYNQTRQILEQSIFDAAANAARQNAEIVETWLRATGNELYALANTPNLRSMDWSQQLPVLQEVVSAHDDYEMMFVVDTREELSCPLGEKPTSVIDPIFRKQWVLEERLILTHCQSGDRGSSHRCADTDSARIYR